MVAAMSATTRETVGQSPVGATGAARRARIDALFSAFAAPGVPGAAVVVARGDSIVFAAGYGLADVDHGVAVTPSTAFRLASVTKQFTAAAILTLVEAGKLTLDDRLGDLLADVPAYGRHVNVRQLLTHTSGIPDYEPLLGSGDGPQLADRDVLALLRAAKALYFTPDRKSTRLNSSHSQISYAVFCLKKKIRQATRLIRQRRDSITQ